MTTTLKQMLSPEVVEALTLSVPTGSHEHAIDPSMAKTVNGGAHKHTFRLPSGELLVTDLSGPHEHDLYLNREADEASTCGGGDHVHTITLDDGTVLKTEIDGWHYHEFHLKTEQGEVPESDPQGQHRHRLVLPSGGVIMSLMPGDELMELSTEAGIAAHRANMQKGYPSTPNGEGVAEVVVCEKAASVRLTLGFDESKYVVDLDVARKGAEVETAAAAVEGFGLHGYRYMHPVIGATCKAKVSRRASGGDTAVVDKLAVTWGLQSETSREVFLKGEHFSGTLTLTKGALGWSARFERVTTPAVLSKGAPLPPRGFAALPDSLVKTCPQEFAYWRTENPVLAKQQRDALTVSGFFAAESLALVAGELRKVDRVTTTRLYEPGGERVEVRTYAAEVGKLLPRGVKEVVVQTKAQHWEDLAAPEGGVRVVDGPSLAEMESLAKCEDPLLVIAADSPEARRALEKLGQPFTLAHPDAHGKVLVTTYDLSKAGSMEAVTFLAPSEPVEPPKMRVVQAEKAAPESGTLRLISKAADDSEERYVLGIVLEPLTVESPDAQGDIYDAATIKRAAHLYMERFQNIGLQHKQMVSDRVILLESYLAPANMTIGTTTIKAGTWMMAVRIDDEDLWAQVKSGAITGFSIGGWATRTQVDEGASGEANAA